MITREPFVFEGVAKSLPDKLAVWTDGVVLQTEDSRPDRQAGFVPAYQLKKGRWYRITIEELPEEPK